MDTHQSKTSLRILLIEDDEDDYLITRRMLRRALGDTATLTWISRYEQALIAIRQGEYDVYLIDYRLDTHTAIELLHVLRQRGNTTPALILTHVDDYDIDVLVGGTGAADYLVKDHLEPLRVGTSDSVCP